MTNKEKTQGRKFAFQFLFQTQSNKNADVTSEELLENICSFEISYIKEDEENIDNSISHNAKEFGKNLIHEFLKYDTEIEEVVSKHLDRNNLSKLNLIDQTLIKLGSIEIVHLDNTPSQVVINDIVELAKKFGESESYAMINGVLDSVWKSK